MFPSNLTFIVSKWLRNKENHMNGLIVRLDWLKSSTLIKDSFLRWTLCKHVKTVVLIPCCRMPSLHLTASQSSAWRLRDVNEELGRSVQTRFHSSNWISSTVSTEAAVPGYLSKSSDRFSIQNDNKMDIAMKKLKRRTIMPNGSQIYLLDIRVLAPKDN